MFKSFDRTGGFRAYVAGGADNRRSVAGGLFRSVANIPFASRFTSVVSGEAPVDTVTSLNLSPEIPKYITQTLPQVYDAFAQQEELRASGSRRSSQRSRFQDDLKWCQMMLVSETQRDLYSLLEMQLNKNLTDPTYPIYLFLEQFRTFTLAKIRKMASVRFVSTEAYVKTNLDVYEQVPYRVADCYFGCLVKWHGDHCAGLSLDRIPKPLYQKFLTHVREHFLDGTAGCFLRLIVRPCVVDSEKEYKMRKLRLWLLPQRIPFADERLRDIPWSRALASMGEITETVYPEQMLQCVDRAIDAMFVDDLPQEICITPTDFSLAIAYVIVHSDIYKIAAYLEYILIMCDRLLHAKKNPGSRKTRHSFGLVYKVNQWLLSDEVMVLTESDETEKERAEAHRLQEEERLRRRTELQEEDGFATPIMVDGGVSPTPIPGSGSASEQTPSSPVPAIEVSSPESIEGQARSVSTPTSEGGTSSSSPSGSLPIPPPPRGKLPTPPNPVNRRTKSMLPTSLRSITAKVRSPGSRRRKRALPNVPGDVSAPTPTSTTGLTPPTPTDQTPLSLQHPSSNAMKPKSVPAVSVVAQQVATSTTMTTTAATTTEEDEIRARRQEEGVWKMLHGVALEEGVPGSLDNHKKAVLAFARQSKERLDDLQKHNASLLEDKQRLQDQADLASKKLRATLSRLKTMKTELERLQDENLRLKSSAQ